MGLLGWICMILFGLIYLPDLTSFLICLAIAFFFVVLVLDQFGLMPKGAERK